MRFGLPSRKPKKKRTAAAVLDKNKNSTNNTLLPYEEKKWEAGLAAGFLKECF